MGTMEKNRTFSLRITELTITKIEIRIIGKETTIKAIKTTDKTTTAIRITIIITKRETKTILRNHSRNVGGVILL